MKKQKTAELKKLYVVFEVPEFEIEDLIIQIKQSKKLKYLYHWINGEWNEIEQTTTSRV